MADYPAKRRVLKVIASRGGTVVWTGNLSQGEATIGRSPSSQVVLDDPLVSWTHARVSFGKSGIAFTDCSTNGSFRNGERITTVKLGPGGVISIPPFEVDLSIEVATDSVRGAAASSRTVRPAVPGGLASTLPEPEVSSSPMSKNGAISLTSSETLTLARAISRFGQNVVVLGVIGRLDGYTYGDLNDAISRLIDEGQRGVIVDLTKCQYCDHAGLGVLVNAQVALIGKKGGLRIIGVNPQLKDAVRLLRLDDVLSLAADEKTAALELSALVQRR
jgi:anti-anti-sigma factor